MIRFSPYITVYNLHQGFDILDEVIWTFSKNLEGVGNVRQRFNIHLVKNKESERQALKGGIKSVWRYFDENQLKKEPLSTQKEILLDLVTESFLSVAEEAGWNRTLIINAKEKSLDEGIEFEYLSRRRFNQSKSRNGLVKIKLKKSFYLRYFKVQKQNRLKRNFISRLFSILHFVV